MTARIYQPSKTAMSSGMAKTNEWVLEFASDEPRRIDPLLGWTSSPDTQSPLRLHFPTLHPAKDYAESNGIDPIVTQPKKRGANIRPGGYGDNFATNRRGVWTH